MIKLRQLFYGTLAMVFVLASFTLPVAAADPDQAIIDKIQKNCFDIKSQLRKVQRKDSKTRVDVGDYIESVSTKLMTNLNLRLIKNNRALPELAEQQSKYADAQEEFKNSFVKYSQSLENLLAIDCQSQPEIFYSSLGKVRTQRAQLDKVIAKISRIIDQHAEAVGHLLSTYESPAEDQDDTADDATESTADDTNEEAQE